MKVLELFAGSRSIGKVAEKYGIEVDSLDIDSNILSKLESNLLLCYTGDTRKGEDIIDKQVKAYDDNVKYLHQLKIRPIKRMATS